MDKQWNMLLCDAGPRLCSVSYFIESCRPAHQVKLIRIMKLLEEMGLNLPRPYADFLTGATGFTGYLKQKKPKARSKYLCHMS